MEKLNNYIVNDNGCWVWTGSTNRGYGTVSINGKNVRAHRASFEFHNKRKIKEGYYICHRCDNPPCINPDHLFEGTQKDNIQDCLKKGRHKFIAPKRERLSHCKYGHEYKEGSFIWKSKRKGTAKERYCLECRKNHMKTSVENRKVTLRNAQKECEKLKAALRRIGRDAEHLDKILNPRRYDTLEAIIDTAKKALGDS